eukprot:1486507-Prymnesium_polylepis.1
MRGMRPACGPESRPYSPSVYVLPAPVCPYAISVPLYLRRGGVVCEWHRVRTGQTAHQACDGRMAGTGDVRAPSARGERPSRRQACAAHPLRTDCTSGMPILWKSASLFSFS